MTVAFEGIGATVVNLEASGDQKVTAHAHRFHVETKRRERLALMEWVRQAEAEADAGEVPLVVFRQSRQPWRVVLTLEHLLALLSD